MPLPGQLPPRGRAMHPEWNPQNDALALRKTMKGLGTKDDQLIAIVAGRERNYLALEVAPAFAKLEKKKMDLRKDVASETSFHYKDVATGLLLTEAEYRAEVIMKACKGAGTDDKALIDAVMTATAMEINATKTAFNHLYGKDMGKVIDGDISGDYQRIITKICQGTRPDLGVNPQLFTADLAVLFKATEGKIGTDEKALIELVAQRSSAHCAVLNEEYRAKSKGGKHSFLEIIAKETSFSFRRCLECAFTTRPQWHARMLFQVTKE